MVRKDNGLMPTREIIKRYEEGRNEVAVFLRSKGALLGHEIRAGRKLQETTLVPFPMRHAEKLLGSKTREYQIPDTFPF